MGPRSCDIGLTVRSIETLTRQGRNSPGGLARPHRHDEGPNCLGFFGAKHSRSEPDADPKAEMPEQRPRVGGGTTKGTPIARQADTACNEHAEDQILDGTYEPSPVRKVEIPKPGGGLRTLGIPTVVDRLIQQALYQALQSWYDTWFSDQSFGFRLGRDAHDAVERAREHAAASMCGHGARVNVCWNLSSDSYGIAYV